MENFIIKKLIKQFFYFLIIIRFVNVEMEPSLQHQQSLYILKSNALKV